MGCMLLLSPSAFKACIEHMHRVNIIVANSTFTNVVYETTLAFSRKNTGSISLKLKGISNYCLFCFAVFISAIIVINKKLTPSQFVANKLIQNKIKSISTAYQWPESTLYKNTSSACSSDISYMRKYFENEIGICTNLEGSAPERVFKTQSSPSYRDGTISRIPELKLDAG